MRPGELPEGGKPPGISGDSASFEANETFEPLAPDILRRSEGRAPAPRTFWDLPKVHLHFPEHFGASGRVERPDLLNRSELCQPRASVFRNRCDEPRALVREALNACENSELGEAMAAKKKSAKVTSSKKASKPSAPAVPAEVVPKVEGSKDAFDRFMSEAAAIHDRDVQVFRAEASVAYHNVKAAVTLLAPLKADVATHLPKESFAKLMDTEALALGLVYAANATGLVAGRSSTGISELIKEGRVLRNVLIPAAEAAAASGLLPLAIVQQIKKGKGSLDMAKDCVALADLFQTNAEKLRGKTAISAAQISRAALVGSELIKLVRPKGAKGGRAKSSEKVDLAHARDRLWSLLLLRYDRLERALAYLAGPRSGAPALQSRLVGRRKGAAKTIGEPK